MVRDKAEGPSAKYYVGISDGYELPGSLPAGLRKAAKAQGLTFKNGEFVKVTDKPSSAKTSKTEPKTKKSISREPISEQSLNSKGFKTFKMPQIGTLYLGKSQLYRF